VALDRLILLSCGLPAFALLQFQKVRKGCDPLNSIGMRSVLDLVFEALQLDFLNDGCDIGSFCG
jgi:hypothetical protein